MLRRVVLSLTTAALGAASVVSTASALPSAYMTVGDDNAAGIAQYTIGSGGDLAPKGPFLIGPANDLGGVVLTPDGRSAYVALSFDNAGSGPTTPQKEVLQFDVSPATGQLTPKSTPSATTGLNPGSLAVSPDGRSLYAAAVLDDAISQFDVSPITGQLTPKATASVATGESPASIALTPNGRSAYVANFNGNTISQYDVDPTTGALTPKSTPTVAAPGQPTQVSVGPTGRTLYAPTGAGVMQFDIDPASGALAPSATPVVDTNIPSFVSLSPDGRSAYVDLPNTNQLLQYDVSGADGTLSPKTPPSVTIGSDPFPALNSVGLTPDSRHAYVISGLSSIYGFDASDGGALSPQTPPFVSVPASQHQIAVTPDVPVAAFTTSTSGLTANFGASGSSNVGGSILRYDWDFGDGTSASSSGSQASHAYRAAGTYTAVLTVTSEAGCTAGSLTYVSRMVTCNGASARTTQTVTVATPPPPPPPSQSARTRVLSTSAVVSGSGSKGQARIALQCRTTRMSSCRGRLSLSAQVATRSSSRRGSTRAVAAALVRAGGVSFDVQAGQRATVTVPVGRRVMRFLADRGRTRALVRVSTKQGLGRSSDQTHRSIALRLAKRG